MKKIMIVWLALLLVSCQRTPDTLDIDGHPVNLKQPGEWTLLTYWAPWCSVCVSEFDLFNELVEAHKLSIYGVHWTDESIEGLKSMGAVLNIQFPLLQSDPGKALGLASSDVLPAHYLISPEGKITGPIVGPQTEESLFSYMEDA